MCKSWPGVDIPPQDHPSEGSSSSSSTTQGNHMGRIFAFTSKVERDSSIQNDIHIFNCQIVAMCI